MEDVTARIIVTAESSMAVQGLNNVRKALDDVAEARMKELQLEKARAQLELAEFESARAAEKAYAAEIPLRGAERQLESLKEQHQAHIEMYKTKKKLGELDEKQNRKWTRALKKEAAEVDNLKMKVQELTKAYLPLANAEAGANLAAFNAKEKLDALGKSTQNAAKETEKFSWKMAGARMASRMFSMDLGATSNNMIKYGILAAGAASAAKLVKWGFEQMDKAMIEEAELWKRNNENMKETAASWAEQRQKQNEALEALNGYNEKTQLSAVEQLKMAESLKVLKQGFGDLGIEIDRSTGKIANFDKVSVAYRRKMIEKEKSEIRAQLKNLENEKRAQTELRDTAGVPIWGGNVRIGGEATMLAAGREIERINSESAKLRKRMAELNRMKPDEEAEKLKAAQHKDAESKFAERLADQKREITLIELRSKGLEREAKWLEICARYDKERAKLQNDAERWEFDMQLPYMLENEMKKWEAERKGKADKKKEDVRGFSQNPLGRELFKYRAMAQGAIDANSAEGQRLQSRRLLTSPEEWNKKTADGVSTIVGQLREIGKNVAQKSPVTIRPPEVRAGDTSVTVQAPDGKAQADFSWGQRTADGVSTIVGQLREIGKNVAARNFAQFPMPYQSPLTLIPPAAPAMPSQPIRGNADTGGQQSAIWSGILEQLKLLVAQGNENKTNVLTIIRQVSGIASSGVKITAGSTRKY